MAPNSASLDFCFLIISRIQNSKLSFYRASCAPTKYRSSNWKTNIYSSIRILLVRVWSSTFRLSVTENTASQNSELRCARRERKKQRKKLDGIRVHTHMRNAVLSRARLERWNLAIVFRKCLAKVKNTLRVYMYDEQIALIWECWSTRIRFIHLKWKGKTIRCRTPFETF